METKRRKVRVRTKLNDDMQLECMRLIAVTAKRVRQYCRKHQSPLIDPDDLRQYLHLMLVDLVSRAACDFPGGRIPDNLAFKELAFMTRDYLQAVYNPMNKPRDYEGPRQFELPFSRAMYDNTMLDGADKQEEFNGRNAFVKITSAEFDQHLDSVYMCELKTVLNETQYEILEMKKNGYSSFAAIKRAFDRRAIEQNMTERERNETQELDDDEFFRYAIQMQLPAEERLKVALLNDDEFQAYVKQHKLSYCKSMSDDVFYANVRSVRLSVLELFYGREQALKLMGS